ncbi:MAG TPA: hypothetical protein VEC56_02125 [Candidatus Krumholzibacteria bacterium]|nr:hypothetical protein [Candidatus Krumholzibacteria bacterium]
MKPIDQVIAERAGEWLKIDGVVGVYQGVAPDGAEIICIAVRKETPALAARISSQAGGHRVEIVATGPIEPF